MGAKSGIERTGRCVTGRAIAIAVTVMALMLGFAAEASASDSLTPRGGTSSANHDADDARASS